MWNPKNIPSQGLSSQSFGVIAAASWQLFESSRSVWCNGAKEEAIRLKVPFWGYGDIRYVLYIISWRHNIACNHMIIQKIFYSHKIKPAIVSLYVLPGNSSSQSTLEIACLGHCGKSPLISALFNQSQCLVKSRNIWARQHKWNL